MKRALFTQFDTVKSGGRKQIATAALISILNYLLSMFVKPYPQQSHVYLNS